MSLNEKQQRFLEAYLIDPNATKAAIAARYSPKTADVQGSRLLRHPEIAAELTRRRSHLAEATGVTAERVIAEFARIAFGKITDLVSWRSNVREMGELDEKDGQPPELVVTITNQVELVDSDKLAPGVVAAIAEVSRSANGTIKVKMHDKLGALTKLGLHFGLFNRVEKPAAPGKKEIQQAEGEQIPDRNSPWSELVH